MGEHGAVVRIGLAASLSKLPRGQPRIAGQDQVGRRFRDRDLMRSFGMRHVPAFPWKRASNRGSALVVTRRVSPGPSSMRSNPSSRIRLSPAASVR
jgi:hypothetical protein